MNIDYYPIDPDAIRASLDADDRQRVEDLCDSLDWYRRQNDRHGGWTRAIEQCEEELEELTGTSDVDELEAVLEAGDERDGPTDQEREIAECEERADWYEDHGWSKATEREYDRLAELKEDG
jgi:hypothetical protein